MEDIEVIAINQNTGEILKKIMKLDEWHIFYKTKRKKGFIYIPYKLGYSQFN